MRVQYARVTLPVSVTTRQTVSYPLRTQPTIIDEAADTIRSDSGVGTPNM